MDTQTIILIMAAFLTSTLSGFLGMGGGILLLAVMGLYFPPSVLIPLHGVVQFVSNGARVAINVRHIAWRVLIPMVAGCVVGALACALVVVRLPDTRHQLILGLFILAVTWLPRMETAPRIRGKFFWLGGVSTALSLVVGATGPLVAPFYLNEDLKKEAIIATKAGGQAATHVLKVGVFSLVGFQAGEHAALLAGMIAAAAVGTWCGKLLLGRVSETVFLVLYKLLITALACWMVYKGVAGD